MADMKEIIIEYVTDEYLDDEDDVAINSASPLISSGIVDSFSMVSLKRFLESRYHVHIPDSKATPEAFDTVDNIVALLRELGVEQ